MTTIYRVVEIDEKTNKFVGFYRSQTKNLLVEVATDYYYRHSDKNPNPFTDRLLSKKWFYLFDNGSYKDYYFGFYTKEQLQRWFFSDANFVDALREHGRNLAVLVIETEDYYLGEAQVIFHKETSKEIDIFDFWDFAPNKE